MYVYCIGGEVAYWEEMKKDNALGNGVAEILGQIVKFRRSFGQENPVSDEKLNYSMSK